MKIKYKIIYCDYISPLNQKSCSLARGGALILHRKGQSYVIDQYLKGASLKRFKDSNKGQFEELDYGKAVAVPGFYDMHFHWVQEDVRMMPKDSLLTWLSEYTWPTEAKYKSPRYSQDKAIHFAQELIDAGTLGGGCYSSLHPHSVDHAFKHFVGDFVVGHVLMDMNSPKYLTHKTSEAKQLLKTYLKKYQSSYAVTPRFAPTSHPDLMKFGADLSRKYKSFIQTHLAETPQEIEYVMEIYRQIKGFEKVQSYTEIYHQCGILGPRTIMGHGIYLSQKEWKLLAKTKTAIAHCPTSNAPVKELGLGSGLFDFYRANKEGVRWALASDIGGGPYLSMLDVMNSFLTQHQRAAKKVTAVDALYRSTLAGAEILKCDKVTGNLEKGKKGSLVLFKQFSNSQKAETQIRDLLESVKGRRDKYQRLSLATFHQGDLISSKTGQ